MKEQDETKMKKLLEQTMAVLLWLTDYATKATQARPPPLTVFPTLISRKIGDAQLFRQIGG